MPIIISSPFVIPSGPLNLGEAALLGGKSGGSLLTSIEIFDFPTETSSYASNSLTTAVRLFGATCDGTDTFYAGGNVSAGGISLTSNIDKYTHSSQVVTNITATLGTARMSMAAAGNIDMGYYVGGYISGETNRVDNFVYATETRTQKANYSAAVQSPMGFSSPTLGIFSGGQVSGGTEVNTTTKITFASDAHSSGGALVTGKQGAGASSNGTFGVVMGGFISSAIANVQKYSHGSDSWTTGTALGFSTNAPAGAGNARYAYAFGGWDNGSTWFDTVDQYEYATDARVASTSLLGTRGQAAAGSTTHGGL